MKEVSRFQLLTVEEEKELGRRALTGDREAVQRMIGRIAQLVGELRADDLGHTALGGKIVKIVRHGVLKFVIARSAAEIDDLPGVRTAVGDGEVTKMAGLARGGRRASQLNQRVAPHMAVLKQQPIIGERAVLKTLIIVAAVSAISFRQTKALEDLN